ncbi:MAG: hypothetical protein ACK53L_21655, partial [Pirellulaceae bacterium]
DGMAGAASDGKAAAAALVQHPWAARAWTVDEKEVLEEVRSKTAFEPLVDVGHLNLLPENVI